MISAPGLMNDPKAMDVIANIAYDMNASVVVFDTLSSLWGGKGEVNDEAAEIIASLVRLAEQTSAAVLLTHHAGWNDRSRARGASALEANVDDVLALGSSDGLVSLVPTKRRNGELGQGMTMQLTKVEDTKSAVLMPVDARGGWQARILSHLDAIGPGGISTTELRQALGIEQSRSPGRSAFYTALSQLRKRKVVEAIGSGRLRLMGPEATSETSQQKDP